jgi:hypothetical protein
MAHACCRRHRPRCATPTHCPVPARVPRVMPAGAAAGRVSASAAGPLLLARAALQSGRGESAGSNESHAVPACGGSPAAARHVRTSASRVLLPARCATGMPATTSAATRRTRSARKRRSPRKRSVRSGLMMRAASQRQRWTLLLGMVRLATRRGRHQQQQKKQRQAASQRLMQQRGRQLLMRRVAGARMRRQQKQQQTQRQRRQQQQQLLTLMGRAASDVMPHCVAQASGVRGNGIGCVCCVCNRCI